MKCSTYFKVSISLLLYIIVRLCIVKLLLFDNVFALKSTPVVIRHSGTCTFQQSKAACTFNLLCYLAGGIPVEGCEDRGITTCCVLQQKPPVQQILDISKLTRFIGTNNVESTDYRQTILGDSYSPSKPTSSVTYSDDSQQFKNLLKDEELIKSPSTESSLLAINDSNFRLHALSSSQSTFASPFDPLISRHKTHRIEHQPYSLYSNLNHLPPIRYDRPQHTYSIENSHYEKQHQQNFQLHHQRFASHNPLLNSHNSIYHSSIYHQPNHYSSPHHHASQTSSNFKFFQLLRYNEPFFSPYQSNYIFSDNLNYYSGDSLSSPYNSEKSHSSPSTSQPYTSNFNSYALNDNVANINLYSSSITDPSLSKSHSIVPTNNYNSKKSNAQLNDEDINPRSYLNEYQSPPSISSLLSPSYDLTKTIDYKTYQKHSVKPSYLNTDHRFPSLYLKSTSLFSHDDKTNHSTNLSNSNKIYDEKSPIIEDYSTASIESPASINYYQPNHLAKTSTDYQSLSATNYNTQQNSNSAYYPSVDPEEDSHIMLDNSRLFNQDEHNNNAIRRSRLSNSPLNSITIEKESLTRNFIGEEDCGMPISKPTARIIGGQDAKPYEFPWVVHIKVGAHQCGGTLISRDYVATAAHCVYQAPLDKLTLIIGAHDIELKNSKYYDEIPQHHLIENILLHPNFRFSAAHPDRFDIALLKLKRPALYTNSVRPICLPPKQLKLEGWRGVVTGWGKTDSQLANRYGTRLLQKVDVPIIKNQECEKWHQTRGIDIKIFSEMMCAGYENGEKDACVGDSGGPLIIFLNGKWTLVGITSAGFGCAQSKQPGIYHRVSFTVDWILDQLNNT